MKNGSAREEKQDLFYAGTRKRFIKALPGLQNWDKWNQLQIAESFRL
jgi:hypothetical protein